METASEKFNKANKEFKGRNLASTSKLPDLFDVAAEDATSKMMR